MSAAPVRCAQPAPAREVSPAPIARSLSTPIAPSNVSVITRVSERNEPTHTSAASANVMTLIAPLPRIVNGANSRRANTRRAVSGSGYAARTGTSPKSVVVECENAPPAPDTTAA